MDSENNVFEKLGGRKFILAVLVAIAIVAIAVYSPASLTTEVVVGLLGVIAAYSGSNAVLTGLAMRQGQSGANVADIPQQEPGIAENMPVIPAQNAEIELKLNELETRLSQNEKTISEIIEVLKQLMQKQAK